MFDMVALAGRNPTVVRKTVATNTPTCKVLETANGRPAGRDVTAPDAKTENGARGACSSRRPIRTASVWET